MTAEEILHLGALLATGRASLKDATERLGPIREVQAEGTVFELEPTAKKRFRWIRLEGVAQTEELHGFDLALNEPEPLSMKELGAASGASGPFPKAPDYPEDPHAYHRFLKRVDDERAIRIIVEYDPPNADTVQVHRALIRLGPDWGL